MKHIFLSITVVIGSLACTDGQVSETSPLTLKSVQMPPTGIRKSLSDVPINSSTFCIPSFTQNCALEVVQLQRELMELNPVPVPQPNVALPITATEADQLYRQFVTKQAGKPVLALFRQLYPRIMLNKYDLITSRNYSLTTYYVRELIESGSYDFVTQEKALTSIQAHVHVDQFNQLLQKANTNARLYKPRLKQSFDQTMAHLNNPGVDSRLFPEEARKQISARYVDENQATNLAITRLEQLQAGSVHQAR